MIRVECRHPGVQEIGSVAKRGSEEAQSDLPAWCGEGETESRSRAEWQGGLLVEQRVSDLEDMYHGSTTAMSQTRTELEALQYKLDDIENRS
ncbi:hypothetical protein NDU88_003058 [Pleurodeles waltl]|uniref:Uncharacterized protein n=1 Tax=Pleurodeles waltl TaxID=8319 RepID=A0AAV7W4X7_PLEWA|nr:hypothetical protein NDU88_003058 [Pleurodeles waltl]